MFGPWRTPTSSPSDRSSAACRSGPRVPALQPMSIARHIEGKLPGAFEELVSVMPPRAIQDDRQLESSVEISIG